MSATKTYLMDKELNDLDHCDKSNVKTPFGNFKINKRLVKTAFGDVEYTDIKELE